MLHRSCLCTAVIGHVQVIRRPQRLKLSLSQWAQSIGFACSHHHEFLTRLWEEDEEKRGERMVT